MLHEFAVDPACLATIDTLQRVTDHCAFHTGRFISDFPKRKWAVDVFTTIRRNSFLTAHRALDILAGLERRGGLIDTARQYTPPSAWLDNALREHASRPFHGILAAENPNAHPHVVPVGELSSETKVWNVLPEDRVPRTVESLADCVRPLLNLSSSYLFVDPNFEPDRRRDCNSLTAFLAIIAARSQTGSRIEIHTKLRANPGADDDEKKRWKSRFSSDCNRLVPTCVPRLLKITVFVWEELENGDEFHARFVMTERGAIRIDKGLDAGEPGQTTDVGLVAPNVYQSRWADFQPGATTFHLADQFEIIGTK